MRTVLLETIVLSAVITATPAAAGQKDNDIPDKWKEAFPPGSLLKAMEGLPPGNKAYRVERYGEHQGWVLRTEQVDPAVKGRNGQISLLVGLDASGKILAVHLISHREDKKWFNRIKPDFYKRLVNRNTNDNIDSVQTVTGATVSSLAMVKDVFLSAQTLLKLEPQKKTDK